MVRKRCSICTRWRLELVIYNNTPWRYTCEVRCIPAYASTKAANVMMKTSVSFKLWRAFAKFTPYLAENCGVAENC
eukprot:6130252-Lingulodinium_polyedra.AAC.1